MLVGLENQEELARQIIERGYNVRQVEAVTRANVSGRAPRASRRGKDPNTLAFEQRLSDTLGLKVGLDQRGGGGVLHIHYSSFDQLEDVVRKLERVG
jgi:ParB family chromosome partitioning protein